MGSLLTVLNYELLTNIHIFLSLTKKKYIIILLTLNKTL